MFECWIYLVSNLSYLIIPAQRIEYKKIIKILMQCGLANWIELNIKFNGSIFMQKIYKLKIFILKMYN